MSNSKESYGANEFFMGAPNDQFQTLISAETYPQHLGTATSNATSQDMVLVQHPHRCDQPEGATNLVNPSISPQINPCLLPKAGYSQSSNISNAANLEKKLKRREIDKKSRAKKEAISESACSEHQEEIEKWKRKAKKRKVVIEALTRWKDAEQ